MSPISGRPTAPPPSALGAAALLIACLVTPGQAESPQTLYWDGDHLAAIKNAREQRSEEVQQALDDLRANAAFALSRGPYSVVDKRIVPPSGDKHDYLSFSRYWWPNPDTPDGLPYVRRDGEVNRALLSQGDRVRIGMFFDDVESLSLAAYLLDGQEYGSHATSLIHAWFIAPETRMNPNLNFGQGVPGRAHGRGVGIIDTRHFIRMLDSIALLDATGDLSAADQAQLQGLVPTVPRLAHNQPARQAGEASGQQSRLLVRRPDGPDCAVRRRP